LGFQFMKTKDNALSLGRTKNEKDIQ
jgi:hypothetical protein